MNSLKRNSLVLLLLALLFAAPAGIAYLFYQHPQWLVAMKTNRGKLLTPPIKLAAFSKEAKWRIIFWHPLACDTVCRQWLDKLARIRLRLGRHLYGVETWLIGGEGYEPPVSLRRLLKDEDIGWQTLTKSSQNGLVFYSFPSQVFIASPNNDLMLAYSLDKKLNGLFYDIKHLLSLDLKNG